MAGPRNIAGSVVRGADLWGRAAELRALWRLLDRGSVLLVGPRRHGKSSLMYAMLDQPQPDWHVLLFDVEFVEVPEQFALELAAEVLAHPVAGAALKAALGDALPDGRWSRFGRSASDSLRPALRAWIAARPWVEACDVVFDVLRQLPGQTLVVIDEFPMMVATLLDRDPDGAVAVLRWFRARRHAVEPTLRFVLGGSVNIEPRLARLGHSPLLNDLQRLRVEPLSMARAQEFVQAVLTAEAVAHEPDVAAEVVRVARSGVHFYLQVLLDECIGETLRQGGALEAAQIVGLYQERVLGPANRARFAHLIGRLRATYGPLEEGARLVLAELTLHDQVQRTDLWELLKAAACPADPEDVLARLEADYYVRMDGQWVRFSDGVLRDWWARNAPDLRRRS